MGMFASSSYSHSVVVDTLFNVPPFGLFSVVGPCLVMYTSVPSLVLQSIILTRKIELAALFSCPPDV